MRHSTQTYLRILETALQNIRTAAAAGDAATCHLEADHVHNLPRIIANNDEAAESYYWKVERVSYSRKAHPSYKDAFAELTVGVDAIAD